MYSDTGDTTSLVPGFPIRTSSDPRSVDSSPRHIAASHVLHRLSMPRHPPCALQHLQTQKPTISKNQNYTLSTNTPHQGRIHLDARNHYPITKHHTPPPSRATPPTPAIPARTTQVLPQDPTVCSVNSACLPHGRRFVVAHPARVHYRRRLLTASGVAQCHNLFRGAP